MLLVSLVVYPKHLLLEGFQRGLLEHVADPHVDVGAVARVAKIEKGLVDVYWPKLGDGLGCEDLGVDFELAQDEGEGPEILD